MNFSQWSERNASLNAFSAAFHDGTHGLIHELALDLMDDGSVVISGVARSYYGVQLAVHTAKKFGNAYRLFPETRLLLTIRESSLELVITHATEANAGESLSTRHVDRHPPLTIAASAE